MNNKNRTAHTIQHDINMQEGKKKKKSVLNSLRCEINSCVLRLFAHLLCKTWMNSILNEVTGPVLASNNALKMTMGFMCTVFFRTGMTRTVKKERKKTASTGILLAFALNVLVLRLNLLILIEAGYLSLNYFIFLT